MDRMRCAAAGKYAVRCRNAACRCASLRDIHTRPVRARRPNTMRYSSAVRRCVHQAWFPRFRYPLAARVTLDAVIVAVEHPDRSEDWTIPFAELERSETGPIPAAAAAQS